MNARGILWYGTGCMSNGALETTPEPYLSKNQGGEKSLNSIIFLITK